MMFFFQGKIPPSKSLLNRAIICAQYTEELKISPRSKAADVVWMEKAVEEVKTASEIYCGEGGTTFRFLCFLAARQKKKTRVKADPHLFRRPQNEIIEVLAQFGVRATAGEDYIDIEGCEWKWKNPIQVKQNISSQFISGLLLNAWNLEKDLEIKISGKRISGSYLQMTIELLKQLGMHIEVSAQGILIPRGQNVTASEYIAEPDMSSAFSIAALAVMGNGAIIESFPAQSLQGDARFLEILNQMGVPLMHKDGNLNVFPAQKLKPVNINLSSCPDLFPVLSVLCALADGDSILHGAPQLVVKESNRIESTAYLLDHMGRNYKKRPDGIEIQGSPLIPRMSTEKLSSFKDHRVAMAIAVAMVAGFPFQVEEPSVVQKSFPEFWDYFPKGVE